MQSTPTAETKKQPLTIDQREQRDLTQLEKIYGEQEQADAAAHAAALKEQRAQRREANRQEYIGSELMAKYLPQYQAMQGTGGMGTSQTDAAAAYNAYLGRVAGNNAAYAGNVAALEQQKAERDALRDSERREREFSIRDAYEDERQMLAEEESAGVLGLIDGRGQGYYGTDGKISRADYDKLEDFYRRNENRLTEAGKRNAEDILEMYREAIRDEQEQAAMDKQGFIEGTGKISAAPSKYESGKNFEITDERGKVFRVEIGEEVADQVILGKAVNVDSGEVFGYGGKLFVRSQDRVYAVEARENSYKSEFASLYDLYFGSRGSEDGKDAVAVSEGQKVLAEDLPLYVTNGPSVQVGEPFWYGGKKYVKESDGNYYMIG